MVHNLIARRCGNWQARLKKFPVKPCVTVMVTILICYQLARLTWNVNHYFNMDNVYQSAPALLPVADGKEVNKPRDMLPPSVYTLFGNITSQASLENAGSIDVKSRLPVKVAGIIASSIAENSIAIIERGGLQASYVSGDKISGTDAEISSILADKVVINNDGQQEALYLYDGPQKSSGTSPSSLVEMRENLLQHPGKFSDYVSISPVKKDDHIQGYRLNPGTNPEFFKQIGFSENDLAVAINGFDLRQQEQALKFIATINEQTQFMVTVLRDGSEELLFINLAEQ